jgi:hypothetical protein
MVDKKLKTIIMQIHEKVIFYAVFTRLRIADLVDYSLRLADIILTN